MADGFEEQVMEDAEDSIEWALLRADTTETVERLGLADGALPDHE